MTTAITQLAFKKGVDNFESLVNESSINEQTHICFQKGKVKIISPDKSSAQKVNRETVVALENEIRSKFGEKASEAVGAFLDEFRSGEKRMTAKDLRLAFTTAEAVNINATMRKIMKSQGESSVDALQKISSGLGEDVAKMKLVSSKTLQSAVKSQFGEEIVSAIMNNKQVEDFSATNLDALEGVVGDVVFLQSDKYRNASARVRDLSEAFLAAGKFDKDSVKKFLIKNYDEYLAERRAPSFSSPTVEKTYEFFTSCENFALKRSINLFFAEISNNDYDIQSQLGSSEIANKKQPLTDDQKAEFRAQAKVLIENKKQFLALQAELEKVYTSGPSRSLLQTLINDCMKNKVMMSDEVKADIIEKMKIQMRCEVDFGFALECEVKKYPHWTSEQINLYKETMFELKRQFPKASLLFEDSTSQGLIFCIEGRGGYNVGFKPERAKDYLMLCAMFDSTSSGLIENKLDEIRQRQPEGPIKFETAFKTLFPVSTMKVDPANVTDLSNVASQFINARKAQLMQYLLAFKPEWKERQEAIELKLMQTMAKSQIKDKNDLARMTAAQLRTQLGTETMRRIHDESLLMLEREVGNGGRLTINITMYMQYGLSLDRSLQCAVNPPQTITLDDLLLNPDVNMIHGDTRQEAEQTWIKDFERQGERGSSSVTVVLAGNGEHTVKNDTSDLIGEEIIQFNNAESTSKHKAVFADLQTLCKGNENQYIAVVFALSQRGPVGLMKTLAPACGPYNRDLEHSQMNYRVSQGENGAVVLTVDSPETEKATKMHGKYVIYPDGTSVCQELTLTPAV